MKERNIRTLGAVADGSTINTKIIQTALDECAREGGAVLVPPGRFVTGHLVIGPRTTLRLEAGGVLVGSPRLEDHKCGGKIAGLLFAKDAEGIRITGQGTIDGNPDPFFDFDADHDAGDPDADKGPVKRSADGPVKPRPRPGNLVVFSGCKDLLLEDVTIRGSAYWTVHLADCLNATVRNLTIEHDQRIPNNDGIHLTNSRRVVIAGCRITSGDDCVAVSGWRDPKGEPEIHLGFSDRPGSCEDVLVTDCIFSSRSSAVRVWTNETDVRRVRFSNLLINDSNRGLGVFARGAGKIEDVSFENIRVATRFHQGRWWGKAEPIHVSSVPVETGVDPGGIERLSFRNIDAVSENGVVVHSSPAGSVKDLLFSDIRLTLREGRFTAENGGILDVRPVSPDLEGQIRKANRPLSVEGVDKLTVRDFTVDASGKKPDLYESGPVFGKTSRLSVEGYSEQ
jgi:polygalacturonase